MATPAGDLEARLAIVTVSTGVLAAEQLAFSPALPPAKLTAIENLPLGIADKAVFRVTGEPFDLPAGGYAIAHEGTSRTASVEIRPFGRDIVICYFGGGYARELEESGELVAAGEAALVNLFGASVRKHLSQPAATGWHLDPFARGAYSSARPGHAHRRADLAAPLGDRLFFAGEACSLDFFSTCHGAHLSGIDAALAAAADPAAAARGRNRRGAHEHFAGVPEAWCSPPLSASSAELPISCRRPPRMPMPAASSRRRATRWSRARTSAYPYYDAGVEIERYAGVAYESYQAASAAAHDFQDAVRPPSSTSRRTRPWPRRVAPGSRSGRPIWRRNAFAFYGGPIDGPGSRFIGQRARPLATPGRSTRASSTASWRIPTAG